MTETQLTTPTRFVDVGGAKIAYRCWGNSKAGQPRTKDFRSRHPGSKYKWQHLFGKLPDSEAPWQGTVFALLFFR